MTQKIDFIPCPLAEIRTLDAYAAALSAPIDSFLEDHILGSQFYAIALDALDGAANPIGHAALHADALLTQFYITPSARRYAQRIFSELLNQLQPSTAFVPTCDEFFLSHAIDTESGAKVELQAYFFVEQGAPEPSDDIPGLHYRLAEPADAAAIEVINIDWVDAVERQIAQHELYTGFLGGELAALGVIERGRLLPDCASIGMLTAPAFRKRGVGTRTIRYLRGVCRTNGLRALAGCGYSNHLSKQTLEAAGMVTPTRLLRFEFPA